MSLVLKKSLGQLKTAVGMREVVVTRYGDGRTLCVELQHPTNPSYNSTFSTLIQDRSERLDPGFFYAKTWGENTALTPAMINSGWFEQVIGKSISSGFVKAHLWKLKDMSFLPDMIPLNEENTDEQA